jgi:Flp pilus assembly protein TadD
VLEPLAVAQPRAAAVHLELGRVLAATGETEAAIVALQLALSLKPDLGNAWRPLADLLFLAGRTEAADDAYGRYLLEAVRDPALLAAGDALASGDLASAERLLRRHLKAAPTDVAAIRMLAEIATRLGRYAAAERLLARCLDLAPGFAGARYNLAVVLYRQNRATRP